MMMSRRRMATASLSAFWAMGFSSHRTTNYMGLYAEVMQCHSISFPINFSMAAADFIQSWFAPFHEPYT